MNEFPKAGSEKSEEEKRNEFIAKAMEAKRAQMKDGFLKLDDAYPGSPERRKARLEEIANMGGDQLFFRTMNNLACWLPGSKENETVGMYRHDGAIGKDREKHEPSKEQIARKMSLEKDVDAFLKAHGLEEAAMRLADAYGKKKTKEQEAENRDLLSRLYYAMIQKGYTDEELTG